MKNTVLLLLTAASMVLAGCSTDSSSNNPVTSPSSLDKATVATETVFQYIGYTRDGLVAVRGTLAFSISPAGLVGGRWELRGTDPGRIGPQIGRGTLTGNLVNGVLSINLNPQNADNNVMLIGRFSRTEYTGRWQWIGFAGVINAGTFRAERARSEAALF